MDDYKYKYLKYKSKYLRLLELLDGGMKRSRSTAGLATSAPPVPVEAILNMATNSDQLQPPVGWLTNRSDDDIYPHRLFLNRAHVVLRDMGIKQRIRDFGQGFNVVLIDMANVVRDCKVASFLFLYSMRVSTLPDNQKLGDNEMMAWPQIDIDNFRNYLYTLIDVLKYAGISNKFIIVTTHNTFEDGIVDEVSNDYALVVNVTCFTMEDKNCHDSIADGGFGKNSTDDYAILLIHDYLLNYGLDQTLKVWSRDRYNKPNLDQQLIHEVYGVNIGRIIYTNVVVVPLIGSIYLNVVPSDFTNNIIKFQLSSTAFTCNKFATLPSILNNTVCPIMEDKEKCKIPLYGDETLL